MDNATWKALAIELAEVQKTRRELEKREAEIAQQMKDMTNGESYQFENISYVYSERIGSVEYAKIPELAGVDLNLYRKDPVRVWKLNFGPSL